MDKLNNKEKRVLELEKKLDEFSDRFLFPIDITSDFKDLINCVFDCLETEDLCLIHKASQAMSTAYNNVSYSAFKYNAKQKERILIALDIWAAYFLRKANRFYE